MPAETTKERELSAAETIADKAVSGQPRDGDFDVLELCWGVARHRWPKLDQPAYLRELMQWLNGNTSTCPVVVIGGGSVRLGRVQTET